MSELWPSPYKGTGLMRVGGGGWGSLLASPIHESLAFSTHWSQVAVDSIFLPSARPPTCCRFCRVVAIWSTAWTYDGDLVREFDRSLDPLRDFPRVGVYLVDLNSQSVAYK